jgi:hypothetical protein
MGYVTGGKDVIQLDRVADECAQRLIIRETDRIFAADAARPETIFKGRLEAISPISNPTRKRTPPQNRAKGVLRCRIGGAAA